MLLDPRRSLPADISGQEESPPSAGAFSTWPCRVPQDVPAGPPLAPPGAASSFVAVSCHAWSPGRAVSRPWRPALGFRVFVSAAGAPESPRRRPIVARVARRAIHVAPTSLCPVDSRCPVISGPRSHGPQCSGDDAAGPDAAGSAVPDAGARALPPRLGCPRRCAARAPALSTCVWSCAQINQTLQANPTWHAMTPQQKFDYLNGSGYLNLYRVRASPRPRGARPAVCAPCL